MCSMYFENAKKNEILWKLDEMSIKIIAKLQYMLIVICNIFQMRKQLVKCCEKKDLKKILI